VTATVEEYTFTVKQWFAESEGDGKTERLIKLTGSKMFDRR